MTNDLLQTKLYIPPMRAGFVARPRLIEKLALGLPRKFTLVSAPAGFGKTTLITDWLQKSPTAWLSIDVDDNDPVRFLTYMVAALQRQEKSLGATIPSLLYNQPQVDLTRIVTALINGLVARTDPLFLVLDDYHLVENPAIHEQIVYLLEHAPPCLHLVLSSRADPPFSIARWRVRGEMAEIRAADLRFSQDETTAFLNDRMHLNLSGAHIAGLESRTEGWAAGIQLAGLTLQGQSNRDGFIDNFTGSHRYIMDYLTDEVLAHQPSDVQDFLLRTGLLDRFCAALCDELLCDNTPQNRPKSQQMIEQLESANLFLSPLDAERTWYRYHHLFAHLLRERLRQTLPMEQIAGLHRRAARWLAEHDFVDEALTHAAAVDEWEAVSNAVARLAIPLFYEGRSKRVAGWLARIPEAVIGNDPRLNAKRAWLSVINLDWQSVGRYLETAISPSDDPVYRAKADNVRAWHAIITGDPATGMEIATGALAQVTGEYPAEQGELLTTLSQGYFAQGNFEEGVQRLESALAYLERGAHWAGLSGATAYLMRQYLQRGRLQRARRIGKQFVDRFGDEPVMQVGGGLQATAFYALTLYESGALADIPEAERLAAWALEQMELSLPNVEMGIWMRLFLALVKQMRGDNAGADALAEEAADQLRALPSHTALVDHYDLQIRYELLADRNDQAQAWIDRIATLDLSPDHPAQIRNRIRQAQVRLQTKPEEIAALSAAQRELASIAAGQHPAFIRMKALAVLALVNDGLDQPEAARRAVEEALRLAAPEQWVQMFFYPGQRMAGLLAQARPTTSVPEFCATVETALRSKTLPLEEEKEESPPLAVPGLLDPLTERESEVLQLLAQGYANREIANTLFIAVGTTKRHIANIYSKMAVRNRTEATLRARELGLLPD